MSDDPECPYCGYKHRDAWEWGRDGAEEDSTNWCDNCGREFLWSRHVSVSYSTQPIIGPHFLAESDRQLDAEEFPL